MNDEARLQPLRENFLEDLHRLDALKFGEFRLKNGTLSPVYLDLRVLTGCPLALSTAGLLLAEMIGELPIDRLGAIPYAGIPLAVAASFPSGLPSCYYRKERKGYGTDRQIEGGARPGERICLIDDVLTDGASKVEAAQIYRAAGMGVGYAAVLVIRQTRALDPLLGDRIVVCAPFTLPQLVQSYAERGWLEPGVPGAVEDYLGQLPA